MKQIMKCATLYAPGDFRIEQRVIPSRQDKEVLVRVHSAGVCGSDFDRIMKTGTYHFPTIPGHEFAGEVMDPGDSEFEKGERVCAVPLIPCFTCKMCQQGHFGQCEQYDFLGSRRDGGFAEYVSVPCNHLLRLPENVEYSGAAITEPAAVSLHGLFLAGLAAGQSLTVFGCGTLGLLCIQLAKVMGVINIAAIDISESKLERAKALGADVCFNSSKKDWKIAFAKAFSDGCDVAAETAGTPLTQMEIIGLVKKAGTVVYLGTAHHDVVLPPEVFERIVRGELKLIGSWNSYSAPYPGREWHTVLKWLSEGKLDFRAMITRHITLEELPGVMAEPAKLRENDIKIMIEL